MAYGLGAESALGRITALLRKPFEVVPFDRGPRQPPPPPLALTRLIEGEIIPRLLLAHQPPAREGIPSGGYATVRAEEVISFAHQVVVEELDDVLAYVDGLLLRGLTPEQVCFDLLAPAARLLGVMWEEDTCSFADVTVGLCRLQQIVHDLSDRQPPLGSVDGRNILLALVPGDQHTFGLLLVGETFRRAGWRACDAATADREELLEIIAGEAFDVVGLSVSDDRWLPFVPELIADLRLASRNPAVRVLVGGKIFSEQPALFAQVGADAMAEDARLAVRTAERLVDRVFHVA